LGNQTDLMSFQFRKERAARVGALAAEQGEATILLLD
jgi:hypothetical protein